MMMISNKQYSFERSKLQTLANIDNGKEDFSTKGSLDVPVGKMMQIISINISVI